MLEREKKDRERERERGGEGERERERKDRRDRERKDTESAAVGVGILTCTAITPKHANITQGLLRLTTGRASDWRPAFVPQGPRSRLKVRSPLSMATSGGTLN